MQLKGARPPCYIDVLCFQWCSVDACGRACHTLFDASADAEMNALFTVSAGACRSNSSSNRASPAQAFSCRCTHSDRAAAGV
eukprot:3385-Heterococcus_DN1.PRE.2